jgi:GxxExxY protein
MNGDAPQMNTHEHRCWDEVTGEIIRCCYRVSNELGTGFLEKVYENALAIELRACGFDVQQQARMRVHYRGQVVGEYVADLLVNGEVLVELKCCKAFDDVMMAQCMNYLRATGRRVCLLVNFGKPRVEVKRILLD